MYVVLMLSVLDCQSHFPIAILYWNVATNHITKCLSTIDEVEVEPAVHLQPSASKPRFSSIATCNHRTGQMEQGKLSQTGPLDEAVSQVSPYNWISCHSWFSSVYRKKSHLVSYAEFPNAEVTHSQT